MSEKETSLKESKKKKTKFVRNRSGHRVELVFEGKVWVFLPGKLTEAPVELDIPNGIGLYVS